MRSWRRIEFLSGFQKVTYSQHSMAPQPGPRRLRSTMFGQRATMYSGVLAPHHPHSRQGGQYIPTENVQNFVATVPGHAPGVCPLSSQQRTLRRPHLLGSGVSHSKRHTTLYLSVTPVWDLIGNRQRRESLTRTLRVAIAAHSIELLLRFSDWPK